MNIHEQEERYNVLIKALEYDGIEQLGMKLVRMKADKRHNAVKKYLAKRDIVSSMYIPSLLEKKQQIFYGNDFIRRCIAAYFESIQE